MSPFVPMARRSSANPPLLIIVPALLVLAAVLFNPVLAIVNARGVPLTPTSVVLAELALVLVIHIVAFANYRPQMMTWYVLSALLVLFSAYRSFALQQIEAKYLRDVLLIPTFIILGLTFDHRNLTRVVVVVHAIVLAVLVLEAVDTAAYADLFRIQDYYINTRGYDVTDFWNKQSDLFVSATRPDSRIFAFIELHRLSSIFLEPVSLGNYCIIIVAFLCARFRSLGFCTRTFLILGTIVALIGCDGRLAAGASAVIVLATIVAPYLPRHSAILYLPATVIAVFALIRHGGFHAGEDNLPGRLAHTVELLRDFNAAEFLGVSNERDLLVRAVDSGIAYLIMTQSILALVLLWVFIVLGSAERTFEQTRFTHATGIYLSLTMMVSFAFLTIKTAALLWFVYGALQAVRRPTEAARPVMLGAPLVRRGPLDAPA